jgi:predicted ATPase/class 3 adenylate cyclase
VTFLLTDIEGSTQLFRRLGDRYESVLDQHHRLLRATWDDHRGAEFKADGDALLVAFASAADAFAAAVDAQQRLRDATWPVDVTLRVRMGLHTGIAYPRDGDYIALALHRASRVVGAGNGGQVLASADAVAAAGPIDGIAARRLGAYRLRDFEGPTVLHEVTSSRQTEDRFPALRAVPAEGHNLSQPRDAFVGRVDELVELVSTVEAGRLVTLLGPGGIGKTRLATEFALEAAPKWGDGVWMVDLAAIPPAGSVALAAADALGVVPGDASPLDAVVDHLRGQNALVLLDNCEHVLGSARELARALLAGCPATGLLATSRERLGVAGEHTFGVAPLPLTDECVDLFFERAQQRDSTLRLGGDDRAVALEICRRLDGLPLAIELAAARTNVLALTEIVAGLRDRLASLGRRDNAVAERQRTLKALVDWSYDLLDPTEQAVFRRLAVFVGSFDLPTAAAAAGHGEVSPDDVAEVVWSLVDRSLVNVERREGSTRYRLLETMSAVAAEYSQDAGDARATRVALGERYLADFPLTASGSLDWPRRMALEQATLMRLVDPLVDDGEVELAHALARLGVDVDIGRGGRDAALRLLLPLVDPARPASPGSARIHALIARLLADHEDRSEAEGHLAAARRYIEEFGEHDRHGVILLSGARTMLSLRDGTEAALRDAEREIRADLERPLPPAIRAIVLADMALLGQTLGSTTTRAHLAEAAGLAEQLGDVMTLMYVVNNLAEDELRAGETAEAARHQLEAMRLSAELDVPLVTGFALVLAARIAQPAGLDAAAVRLHAAADALFEEQDFRLLPDDRALSDAVLAAARANLGDAFDLEVAAGRAMDLPDVVTAAEAVFDVAMSAPD